MNVGRTTARFSTILSMRPSTAVGKPICSCTASQHLAERVGQRQPQVLQVVRREQVERRRAGADVGPAPVRQLDALGPAGGPGGVDERGEVLGLDRGHRLVDRGRVLHEVLGAERLQVLQAEDPLAVRPCRRR